MAPQEELDADQRPVACGAAELERPAQGLYPVAEADEARAAGGIGTACAVVANLQMRAVATLEMDGTNIVGLLNELEARQLIERRRSPEDRRRHLVELTGAGAEQLAKAESALSAAEDEVLGALDETQPETLYSLLQQAAVDTTVSCTAAIDD